LACRVRQGEDSTGGAVTSAISRCPKWLGQQGRSEKSRRWSTDPKTRRHREVLVSVFLGSTGRAGRSVELLLVANRVPRRPHPGADLTG
jgi:hypothetical protein